MTSLTEFLLARFADLEADVRNRKTYAVGHSERCIFEGGYEGSGSCDCGAVDRVLADVEAKRAIIKFHESWPVLVTQPPEFEGGLVGDPDSVTMRMSQRMVWLTEQEYRNRFGEEPPTAPMLRALALPYADHPDFDESWRP